MYLAKEYFVCNSLFHTLWATESRELTPYMSFQTVDPIILFFYWKSFTIFQLPNHQSPSQVCRFCMWTDPGLALQPLFILSWSSVHQSPWAPSHLRSFYHSLVFFFPYALLHVISQSFLKIACRIQLVVWEDIPEHCGNGTFLSSSLYHYAISSVEIIW